MINSHNKIWEMCHFWNVNCEVEKFLEYDEVHWNTGTLVNINQSCIRHEHTSHFTNYTGSHTYSSIINYTVWSVYMLHMIIIWSRDTRLTILIIFRGWISQDNLSVARDRNNLPVLILNLLRIRDVIIYNLMTLHSYHNTCGNYEK